jgi:tetratricopeptide (TPR) repeat protein
MDMVTAKLDLSCGGPHTAAAGRDGEAISFSSLPEECHELDRVFSLERNNLAVIEQYKRRVELDPSDPVLVNYLGRLYSASGQIEEALACFKRAIELCPSHATGHINLGRELIRVGENVAAIQCLARAIQLQPDHFEAYHQLGSLQHSLGDRKAAKAWYLLALRCSSAPSSIFVELGIACAEMGEDEKAAEYLLRALDTGQLDGTGYLKVGAGLARVGQIARAIEALGRSIELEPNAKNWSELGWCQFQLRDPISAEASYREALRSDWEHAPAHANLALTLLLQGNYLEGFQEFDWRWKLKNFYHIAGVQAPLWRGEPLEGKTILLHAEQGFGDTLQFLRYVPMVASRGARVLLVVQAALHRLVADYPGVSECVSVGRKLPDIDFQCPLMSLARVFGTTFANIPGFDPLALNHGLNDHTAQCSSRMGARPSLVGLAWAGNPDHLTDKKRSLHLRSFLELEKLGDAVSFVSLQHGPAVKQLAEGHVPFAVRDACSNVRDFADTAEVVAGLDLVIAVDTAIAHLAGSMGKPVWVLLGAVPEWRWALEGETTPWYPTMRLFRAPERGGWTELMKQIATELEGWVSGQTL